jgi:C-terminal processing protease CtpA/Prc
MSLDQHATDTDAALFVDRVVPDGPAAAAGIRPGDRILRIEGITTEGMSVADAARRLRGPTDASIALEIATGTHVREVNITRVAPSELWSGAAAARAGAERVQASDVAPAAQVAVPPCRK